MYSEKQMKVDLELFRNRQKEIIKRAHEIELVHEDSVLIERIDLRKLATFLNVDGNADKVKVRESWVGQVIKVTGVDSGDDVKENKKRKLALGDIITYSPDRAYSLNIDGFYEIWILSVDAVLIIDKNFRYAERIEEMLRQRLKVFGGPRNSESSPAHAGNEGKIVMS